jgi:charged multivesicular body protein 6
MLGGRISNQDEEEVEEELLALEAEVAQELPSVPIAQPPVAEQRQEQEAQAERRKQPAMLAA